MLFICLNTFHLFIHKMNSQWRTLISLFRRFGMIFIFFGRLVHGIDISQKYFSDVLLFCNDSSLQNTSGNSSKVLKNQIWLLPDGGIGKKGQVAIDQANVELSEHEGVSNLHIKKIDDMNFGVYWCIQVWSDTTISAIRHTVNIDGPPMHEFYEQQKKNAIVGAIAASVVLGVVILSCVIWYFKCSEKVKRKQRLAEDLSKGVNRYSTQIYDNVGMELYVKKTDKQQNTN